MGGANALQTRKFNRSTKTLTLRGALGGQLFPVNMWKRQDWKMKEYPPKLT